jgi:hypothetical protein
MGRLVIPDVNKNDIIQGTGKQGQNDVTLGQGNSTCMPPDQKSKQNWVTSLSLYKYGHNIDGPGNQYIFHAIGFYY